jgi:hypothetical protein
MGGVDVDAKFFKLFEQWDKEAKPYPRFAELVAASGWTKADGPLPGVFLGKKLGHRCAWSCRWSTYKGMKTPEFYLPVDAATVEQLYFEALDAGYMGIPHANRLLIEAWAGVVPGHEGRWLNQMREAIRENRLHYAEYTSPFSPPTMNGTGGRLMNLHLRPG